jgi:hypothetical protein
MLSTILSGLLLSLRTFQRNLYWVFYQGWAKRVSRAEIIKHLRDKPNSSLAESVRLRTSILCSNVVQPPKIGHGHVIHYRERQVDDVVAVALLSANG